MESATYLHLPSGRTPPVAGSGSFKAILVIEQPANVEWQSQISEWLVQSGCLYMMAWGRDCESWHDCVDRANLSAVGFGDVPDDALVMTTWHSNEPLSEVLWFAAHTAMHPTRALDRTVIVHIAADERKAELLSAYRRAQEEGD